MKNTTTNSKFTGIRRNVNVARESVSAGNVERLQRKAMSKLYKDNFGNKSFIVIKRIDINDSGRIEETYYQTVGLSPAVMGYGKLYTGDNMQLSVRKQKDKDSNELKDAAPVVVGEKETYKLYENIVLVSFVGAESFYEDYRLKGIDINGEKYYPVSGSASMNKRSKVYFANGEADEQFKIINNLTGGLLLTALNSEEEAIDYDTLAGIASRVSLCATTPSLWATSGKTNNVFLFLGSIESADEKTHVKQIDNNFRDGFGIISDGKASDIVSELAEEKVTTPQARRMSYQLRIRGMAGKGHFRAYNLAQRKKEIQMMLTIAPEKCHCWVNGERVNLNNLSDKELNKLAAQIDLIVDKDVAKWGKYIALQDKIGMMEIGLVNMSNKTSGSMGSQIAFKLREDMDEAKMYFEALTERQLVEAEAAKGRISFDAEELKLSNTAYFNCKNLCPEVAATDALLNNYKIKTIDNTVLSRVANLKLSVNSMYLRLVPEDSLLNDCVEVLGARDVEYTMPNGEIKVVRCLEAYSSAFEAEYQEMKAMLAANTVMTDKEKQAVLTNMRVCTGIKSPSQGSNEFEMFYMVTAEEIAERNVTQEYMLYIIETPNNCVIIAQDNTVKRALAGSDFDGDDVTLIFPEFSETETGKIVTGLIHAVHGLIKCYTTLMVQKKVRNGNIGFAALIEYGVDEAIRFGEETAEEQTEENDVADYMNSLDVSSLF